MKSLHLFAAHPDAPRWCVHCGRASEKHISEVRCPYCDHRADAAVDLCTRCGEDVGIPQ